MIEDTSVDILAAFSAVAHVIIRAEQSLSDRLDIDGEDGHHLARVRRLRSGEIVTAADGLGSWRPYCVVESAPRQLSLAATGDIRIEPGLAPPLRVAFSLTKGAKPEVVARHLTELGVDVIIPVVADRSVARPDADRIVTRMQKVAREASMQCRRSRLPECSAPIAFVSAVELPGLVVASRIGTTVETPADGDGWTLLVGPEGGFSDQENAMLRQSPTLAVGDLVLRAETAAIAGAAVLATYRHRTDRQ